MALSIEQCQLYRIPPELRVRIYRFYFDEDFPEPTISGSFTQVLAFQKDRSAILRLSRTIRREALPIYQDIQTSAISARTTMMQNLPLNRDNTSWRCEMNARKQLRGLRNERRAMEKRLCYWQEAEFNGLRGQGDVERIQLAHAAFLIGSTMEYDRNVSVGEHEAQR
jgi:hypothetical protein